jgi:hypothetical protein
MVVEMVVKMVINQPGERVYPLTNDGHYGIPFIGTCNDVISKTVDERT